MTVARKQMKHAFVVQDLSVKKDKNEALGGKPEVVKKRIFEESDEEEEGTSTSPLEAGDFDQSPGEEASGLEDDDFELETEEEGEEGSDEEASEESFDADDNDPELQDLEGKQTRPVDTNLIVGMEDGTPDIRTIRDRISATVRLLSNLAEARKTQEALHPRAHYMKCLLRDAAVYYGYSEYMLELLSSIFGPAELVEFLEANEVPRPVVIRANTLKTRRRELAQALINRGATVEPVAKWTAVGLQVFESPVPIGATPEYMAGHYILQSASSLLPVMALGARPKERILDMAAAPGGKTTHIAADMQNTGCLIANDPSKERARALIANIHRMGVKNTVVCAYDGKTFPKVIGGFDRVLLDAPCSGTGVISKDPSVKTSKSADDLKRLTHLQKELLLAAIDSALANPKHAPSRKGDTSFDQESGSGVIVYSTCSITVEENEQVVQYALEKRPNVRLVATGLEVGKEGFVNFRGKHMDPTLALTRRFYPHSHNMDGFFVAKFVKFAKSSQGQQKAKQDKDANARPSTKKSVKSPKVRQVDE